MAKLGTSKLGDSKLGAPATEPPAVRSTFDASGTFDPERSASGEAGL